MAKWLKTAIDILLKMGTSLLSHLKANFKRYLEKIDRDVTPSAGKSYPYNKCAQSQLAGPVHNLGGGGVDVDELTLLILCFVLRPPC